MRHTGYSAEHRAVKNHISDFTVMCCHFLLIVLYV